MPSREQQKLSTKAAMFKDAVETRKTSVEREHQCRLSRYEQVDERLSEAGLDVGRAQEVMEKFNERERQGLLANCKRWSMEDFDIQRVIGEGSFGSVMLVRQRSTDEFYAVKQMKKSHYCRKNARDRVFAERNLLAEAQTKWFVTLQFAFQDADHIFMVMEFLQGGDLLFHLLRRKRFNVEETRFYMAGLLEALDIVHKLGFVHRDVKPDNIMLTAQGHLKLLDFGLCKHAGFCEQPHDLNPNMVANFEANFGSTAPPVTQRNTMRAQLRSQVGTPQYMAPEVWQGDYGPEADIWSLGISTFECLVGHVPFHAGEKQGREMIKIVGTKIRHHGELLPRLLQRYKQKGYITPISEAFISSVICCREKRFGIQESRKDAFFFSIDFANLHLMQPPIVPNVSHSGDVSFFDNFDDSAARAGSEQSNVAKKDTSLEWFGYEFSRTAQELQRFEQVIEQDFDDGL